MPVINILFWVDEICRKYEKYDPNKQFKLNAFGYDAKTEEVSPFLVLFPLPFVFFLSFNL